MKKFISLVLTTILPALLHTGVFAADTNTQYTTRSYGEHVLNTKDSITMDAKWEGTGVFLVLLTREKYSIDEVGEYVESGFVPVGGKNGVKPKLAEKFSDKQILLSVSNCNKLNGTLPIPTDGTYYLYTVMDKDCKKLTGTIAIGIKEIDLKETGVTKEQ